MPENGPPTAWIGVNRGFAPLFADPQVAALFGTSATVRAMAAFERALARALAAVGTVDRQTADAAIAAIDAFEPDLEGIERASLTDGLPAPEFVRQLKRHVRDHAGEAALGALHVGATSQDLLDTGLAMSLRDVAVTLGERIAVLRGGLNALRERFGANGLMGRTRMQAALPITVGDRLAVWERPLAMHLERLGPIRPRVERVQFGGPVGTRSEPREADEVMRHLARELGLHPGPCWHTDRTGPVEFGQWLALVCGSLGKIGQDVALMSQQGVEAIRLAGGGSSSVMPHKRNPVLAEHLVAQARFASGLAGTLHHAGIHEQERSGSAWALEWMTLPLLAETCGSALVHARRLIASIEGMGED